MQNDSSKKGFRVVVMALVSVSALLASAAAGAWMQASLIQKVQPEVTQVSALLGEQVERDGQLLRQNLDLLAEKVGDLQARVIAMDVLGQRIADVAGVDYKNTRDALHTTQPHEVSAEADNEAGELPQASVQPLSSEVSQVVSLGALSMADLSVMDEADQDNELLPVDTLWTAEGLGRQVDQLARELAEKNDWFALLDNVLTQRSGLEASLPTFRPVDYPYLTSSFGWRRHPVTGRQSMHEGLDFSAPRGAPIYAASGGVVTDARYRPGYGKLVEINHGNGLVTRYAHASSINVKMGQVVTKGEMIARVGSTGRSTGPHLHFEVRMAGEPLDPRLFIDQTESPERLLAKVSAAPDAD